MGGTAPQQCSEEPPTKRPQHRKCLLQVNQGASFGGRRCEDDILTRKITLCDGSGWRQKKGLGNTSCSREQDVWIARAIWVCPDVGVGMPVVWDGGVFLLHHVHASWWL